MNEKRVRFVIVISDYTPHSMIGNLVAQLLKGRIEPIDIEVVSNITDVRQVIEFIIKDPESKLFLTILDWPTINHFLPEQLPLDREKYKQVKANALKQAEAEASKVAQYIWDSALLTGSGYRALYVYSATTKEKIVAVINNSNAGLPAAKPPPFEHFPRSGGQTVLRELIQKSGELFLCTSGLAARPS